MDDIIWKGLKVQMEPVKQGAIKKLKAGKKKKSDDAAKLDISEESKNRQHIDSDANNSFSGESGSSKHKISPSKAGPKQESTKENVIPSSSERSTDNLAIKVSKQEIKFDKKRKRSGSNSTPEKTKKKKSEIKSIKSLVFEGEEDIGSGCNDLELSNKKKKNKSSENLLYLDNGNDFWLENTQNEGAELQSLHKKKKKRSKEKKSLIEDENYVEEREDKSKNGENILEKKKKIKTNRMELTAESELKVVELSKKKKKKSSREKLRLLSFEDADDMQLEISKKKPEEENTQLGKKTKKSSKKKLLILEDGHELISNMRDNQEESNILYKSKKKKKKQDSPVLANKNDDNIIDSNLSDKKGKKVMCEKVKLLSFEDADNLGNENQQLQILLKRTDLELVKTHYRDKNKKQQPEESNCLEKVKKKKKKKVNILECCNGENDVDNLNLSGKKKDKRNSGERLRLLSFEEADTMDNNFVQLEKKKKKQPVLENQLKLKDNRKNKTNIEESSPLDKIEKKKKKIEIKESTTSKMNQKNNIQWVIGDNNEEEYHLLDQKWKIEDEGSEDGNFESPYEQQDWDSCDDDNVQVDNLKYAEICNLFAHTDNESYLGSDLTFTVPQLHDTVEDLEMSDEEIVVNNRLDYKSEEIQKNPQSEPENSKIVEDLDKSGADLNDTRQENNAPSDNEPDVQLGLNMQFIKLENDDKVIILNPSSIVHFYGLVSMEILEGDVEILGAELCKTSGSKKVYSPRGTALLYIKNLRNGQSNQEQSLSSLIDEALLLEQWKNLLIDSNQAVILCKKLKEPYIDFILKHISQRVFPYEKENSSPTITFDSLSNKVKIGEKWDTVWEVSDKVSVICGGKGVGKSTFLRYTVNKLLKRFKKVRVIDLDPGQSEFTVPGCISIVTVEDYLLGPNYTHHQNFDRAILANINVGHDIQKYLESVEDLVNYCYELEPLPTLINFCGYVTGLGLDMALKIIQLVKPAVVIQIKSALPSKNYAFDLTVDKVTDSKMSYEFIELDSLADRNDNWKLEARQAREINVLSYLGKMMSESVCELTSCHLNMFSINLTSINVTNLDGASISPLSINANLVALCSASEGNLSIFVCRGWAFVRGVDLQSGFIVLLTPESLDVLNEVNHLVLGSVAVPPSLIMSAEGIRGHVCYVNVGKPVDLGAFTRRSYLPPKK